MDDPSMNQYEQQLYSVFKSFDVNNEESLDESAVNNLCDALQLEERGAALVDTLFERRDGRVTFAQFRNGLLAVLGEPRAPPEPPPPAGDDAAPDATPDVAPRLVFGSKKYGRRSRPQHAAAAEERAGSRAASASRLEADEWRSLQRPRYRRSASAVDRRDDEPALEHDRRIGREEALALCRTLHMHSIDRRLVERIFDDSPTPETTVGEFFDRLNSSLASTMGEAGSEPSGAVVDGDDAEVDAAAERIAEAWESAGVRRPRRLLAELGFAGAAVRPPDLERALDEELRAFDEPLDERGALFAAALALSRMRASDAARRRDLAAAERDKLRGDVAEANGRARLLAQEVDENHARIENELKTNLKRAEARFAEEARRAAAEAAAEQSRLRADCVALEGEAARRGEAETRLRGEAEALRTRAEELEARALGAEERGAVAEREGAKLAARLREAEARGAGAAEAASAAVVLAARVAELQAENQCLRDRADELSAALEARPVLVAPALAPPGGDLSAELGSLMDHRHPEESAPELNSPEARAEIDARVETEARGDSPVDENRKLANLVKDLEGALEAMRGEYEACEEYWSGKLADERAAHDADARAADDRLADLVARIADFERRLAPPPALPPIPEAAALEAQVADLDAEFARYRRDARARLAALADRLARAERRPAPPPVPAPAPPPAPPPRELAARCARAEGAVRRLHARLAAADLLVKELYVENCQLAHARPPLL